MNDEVLQILRRVGALITDTHVVFTSGRHGSVYINKDAIYPHTKDAARIGELFAQAHKDASVDVVVGPALGGIILSQWTAYHLSKIVGREVLGVYTEKDAEKNQVFTRGYDKLVAGKNVLVVEDVITTGGSIKKAINSVAAAGGKVVAAVAIVNRNPKTVDSTVIGAPFTALADFPSEDFAESDCPLCKQGVPVNTSVGHGRQYMEKKNGKI